jgi:hypothetical protein
MWDFGQVSGMHQLFSGNQVEIMNEKSCVCVCVCVCVCAHACACVWAHLGTDAKSFMKLGQMDVMCYTSKWWFHLDCEDN